MDRREELFRSDMMCDCVAREDMFVIGRWPIAVHLIWRLSGNRTVDPVVVGRTYLKISWSIFLRYVDDAPESALSVTSERGLVGSIVVEV